MNLSHYLRIYRTFSWKCLLPSSEIRYGGKNPLTLVAHDELQFFHEASGSWVAIPIVEAEKPEHPDDREQRKRNEEMSKAFDQSYSEIKAALVRAQRVKDQGPQAGETLGMPLVR